MKKRTKRILSAAGAVLMAYALVGCGKEEAAPETQPWMMAEDMIIEEKPEPAPQMEMIQMYGDDNVGHVTLGEGWEEKAFSGYEEILGNEFMSWEKEGVTITIGKTELESDIAAEKLLETNKEGIIGCFRHSDVETSIYEVEEEGIDTLAFFTFKNATSSSYMIISAPEDAWDEAEKYVATNDAFKKVDITAIPAQNAAGEKIWFEGSVYDPAEYLAENLSEEELSENMMYMDLFKIHAQMLTGENSDAIAREKYNDLSEALLYDTDGNWVAVIRRPENINKMEPNTDMVTFYTDHGDFMVMNGFIDNYMEVIDGKDTDTVKKVEKFDVHQGILHILEIDNFYYVDTEEKVEPPFPEPEDDEEERAIVTVPDYAFVLIYPDGTGCTGYITNSVYAGFGYEDPSVLALQIF